MVTSIPIRYGVNILERTWGEHTKPGNYSYWADPAERGGATFFAYEWVNPRLGKRIESVSVRGSSGFRNTEGKVIGGNAVLLKELSYVKARTFPDPVRAR